MKPQLELGQTLYRYEDNQYYETTVDLYEYRVVKLTPKGCWVRPNYGFNNLSPYRLDDYLDRFVLNNAVKKLCYPTKRLALESFLARKRKQLSILGNQVSRVERAIVIAKSMDIGA